MLKYRTTTQLSLIQRIVVVVVEKFPMFYGSKMFITVFTTGLH